MSDVKFELNYNGVRELMKSPEMMNCLMDYAKDIRNAAGNGYETSEYTGRNRANVSVYADTQIARQDNLKNNTLLKALGSARK